MTPDIFPIRLHVSDSKVRPNFGDRGLAHQDALPLGANARIGMSETSTELIDAQVDVPEKPWPVQIHQPRP